MEVTYDTSDPAIQWRCGLYSVYSRPLSMIIILAAPIWICFIFDYKLITTDFARFLLHALIGVVGWSALMTFIIGVQILQRTYKKTRVCTTTITPEGLVDVSPNKTALIPWYLVKAIKLNRGDLYFFSESGCSFIPRTAFPNSSDAQSFADAAAAARRGDFSMLSVPSAPEPVAMVPDGVWPPPPMQRDTGYIPPQLSQPSNAQWYTIDDLAKRAKVKRRLQLLQICFTVPLIVIAFLGRLQPPTNPIQAINVLLFHLIVLAVCLPGSIIAWILGRKY